MPDSSFPQPKPPVRVCSAIQTLSGAEQESSLFSLVVPAKESWLQPSYQNIPDSGLLFELARHAEPLSPLRQRDEHALGVIFNDTQIEEIFSDVCFRLRQLYPEPCWDDDSFDFLKRYLS